MKKRNFSAEFKRESAQLVVDQNYTVADAAKAMDVGLSTMTRWVKQLRDERQGKTPKASPITPEQIEIRELRKKLQRIEMENEILKKATVDSIGQRNSYVKTWGCGGFSTTFSALAETLDNQEEAEKLTIEPTVKNQSLPLAVSYVGETPEGAQKQLAKYIQQVDDQVNEELEKDLKDNIALRMKNLQDSLKTQEVVAQEQKDLRIRQIQEALQYANQAQVTKPQVQQTEDVTQDTLFLLGSEALESMIKHEATRPLVFSSNYYQTRQNLLDIESLKVDDLDIHAYRYVMKPTLPIRRDSPKKAITLILAVLLGGMVGAGIMLGRNALRNYNAK